MRVAFTNFDIAGKFSEKNYFISLWNGIIHVEIH